MKRLYERTTEKPTSLNRVQAVRYYKTAKCGSKAFGLFVQEMKRHKIDYAVIPNTIAIYQTARKEYRKLAGMVRSTVFIRRVVQGHAFRAEYIRSANSSSLYNMKDALDSIKSEIRSFREQLRTPRRNASPIDYKIATRESGYWQKQFEARMFQDFKHPTSDLDFTGIEIECVFPNRSNYSTLKPFAKWLNIGTDGSINVDQNNHDGKEFRVCIPRDEIREVMPKLLAELKALGAYVNKSCGLHVHLDQRNEKDPALTYAKLVRSLGLLMRVVPQSRRENSYCRRNRSTDFKRGMNGERYKAINATAYPKHNTIEVRLFGGSLDADKIVNWIEILWGIAKGEMTLRCPRTFDAAMKYWKISEENLAWLKAREIKFAALNTSPVSESDDEERPEPLEEDNCDCGDCEDCGYAEDELIEEAA